MSLCIHTTGVLLFGVQDLGTMNRSFPADAKGNWSVHFNHI